ncbi:hypothetical protein REPUB_Repub03eG0095300 [Reevesia pubescens]
MVTPINLFGYGFTFLGVAYYNHAKLKGLRKREAQRKAEDEENGKLLDQRKGDGTSRRNESHG